MPTPALAVPRVMEKIGAMEIVNGRMESANFKVSGNYMKLHTQLGAKVRGTNLP